MKLWKVNTTGIYCHCIVMAETEEAAKDKAQALCIDPITTAEELSNGVYVDYE